jgi:Amt family ammonium transporter
VHIVSATTSLVYSIFCKWRRPIFGLPPLQQADQNELNRPSRPRDVVNVVLGTAFLWIGWFGFNGGTALGANLRAVSACISTHLAACAGGVTGTLIEYVAASRMEGDAGRFSVIAFCNGAVAGLVAITPAAGYVSFSFTLACWILADEIGAVLVSSYLRHRGERLRCCVRGYQQGLF